MCMTTFHFKLQLFYKKSKMKTWQIVIGGTYSGTKSGTEDLDSIVTQNLYNILHILGYLICYLNNSFQCLNITTRIFKILFNSHIFS